MKRNDLNFIPTIVQKTMFYCQNVLPMHFDNTLSLLEMVGALRAKVNEIIKAVNNQNLSIVEFQKLIALKEEEFEKVVNNQLAEVQESWNAFKTDLLADIQAYETQVNTQLSSFASQLVNMSSDLSNFAYQLSQFETQLQAVEARVTTAESDITQLQTETQTNTQNIASNTNRIATAESAIVSQGNVIAQNSSDIEQNTLDIAENATNIQQLQNDFADRVGRIATQGETVVIGEDTYTIGNNAEFFNDYSSPSSNYAIGNYSHAEGRSNKAVGNYSHAEGFNNYAFGSQSSVGGASNETHINSSFVHGVQIIAPENTLSNGGAIVGKFNNYEETGADALFVVGNGNTVTRSNAFIVLESGHIIANGTDILNELAALRGEIELLRNNALNAQPLTEPNNGFIATVSHETF